MKFQTNINCSGCIAQVKPYLDKIEGLETWDVDTRNPKKYLSVEGNISQEAVVEAVHSAGFEIKPVKDNWLKRLLN